MMYPEVKLQTDVENPSFLGNDLQMVGCPHFLLVYWRLSCFFLVFNFIDYVTAMWGPLDS